MANVSAVVQHVAIHWKCRAYPQTHGLKDHTPNKVVLKWDEIITNRKLVLILLLDLRIAICTGQDSRGR